MLGQPVFGEAIVAVDLPSVLAFEAHCLGENVDTALHRVTQEALTHVLRHAQASQLRIHLERSVPSLIEPRTGGA